MRGLSLLLLAAVVSLGQTISDPTLSRAYEGLRIRNYDAAITRFLEVLQARPDQAAVRKDLAYTYLKIGENDLARAQFREAMRLDPHDTGVALEYAFLAFEAKQQAEARRIFDRVRKTGNPVAENAFQNIDRPLAAGIERWKKAIALGVDDFGSHYELATFAEQRDDLNLAAEHYKIAWQILPDRRFVLVDLGRVWKALDRIDDANAALLAASRGGEPRAAEAAREFLPNRYPFVPEFRRALGLDPRNVELRRELAYLLLRMGMDGDAEAEFRVLVNTTASDLLSATQLGFLLYARGEMAAAQTLFDRVLAGDNEDLANRVRAVLRVQQVLKPRAKNERPNAVDAKFMAERSINAGFLKDALKYLGIAHEADPQDTEVVLKLGWTNNMLHQDGQAYAWFDQARKSPDPRIAAEASTAWKNLRFENQRFRTSAWFFPMFSTRWHDAFAYGQVRIELRTPWHLRPYVSLRFIGDSAFVVPRTLSEQAVIGAVGLTTDSWHGARLWFEAGAAFGYKSHRILPDYRGGLSFAKRYRKFADTTIDALYISRFDKDFLVYNQSRIGYLSGPLQVYWNGGITADVRRQYWANYVETGPGLRIVILPSLFVTVNALRGVYLRNDYNPYRPNFMDLRAGIWYAISR